MKYILSILSLILFNSSLPAQVFTMKKGSYQFEDDLKQTIHVELEPDGKSTSKAFRKFLKDNHDIKLSWLGWKNRKAEEVEWSELTGTDNPVTIFTKFQDLTEGSDFQIAIKKDNGRFINPKNNASEFDNLENIIAEFLSEYLPDNLNEKIEQVNSAIADLDKELKRTRKDYNKNKKDMGSNAEEIEELTEEIQELKEENASMEQENETLKSKIEAKEREVEQQHEELFKQREKLQKTKLKLIQKLDKK